MLTEQIGGTGMAVNSDIENLKSIPLFTAFEPGALQLLVFGAETRLLRAGDVLFRRGEASNGRLYYLGRLDGARNP